MLLPPRSEKAISLKQLCEEQGLEGSGLRQALADRLAEAGCPNTAQLKKLCEVLEVGQSGGRVVRWLVGLAKKLQAESVEEEEAEAAQTPPLLPQRSRTRLLPVHGSPHACSLIHSGRGVRSDTSERHGAPARSVGCDLRRQITVRDRVGNATHRHDSSTRWQRLTDRRL